MTDKLDEALRDFLSEERQVAQKTREFSDAVRDAQTTCVPEELVAAAKKLIPGDKKYTALCPHCGKTFTPFKKPVSSQKAWGIFWLSLTAGSFVVSFLIPRFFLQFLALALLAGFKWVLDRKALKTQVLIYKAIDSDGPKDRSRHLHGASSRL